MTDIAIGLLPAWLIFLLALATMAHRLYVAWRWKWDVISRWENVLYAIALLNYTVFYFGRWVGWIDIQLGIVLSRFFLVWLLIVSLYISHRMASRHRDGLE